MAQVPYFVKRSFVKRRRRSSRPATPFIVELKGVGWTQLDNTVGGHLRQQLTSGTPAGSTRNGYVRIQLFGHGQAGDRT